MLRIRGYWSEGSKPGGFNLEREGFDGGGRAGAEEIFAETRDTVRAGFSDLSSSDIAWGAFVRGGHDEGAVWGNREARAPEVGERPASEFFGDRSDTAIATETCEAGYAAVVVAGEDGAAVCRPLQAADRAVERGGQDFHGAAAYRHDSKLGVLVIEWATLRSEKSEPAPIRRDRTARFSARQTRHLLNRATLRVDSVNVALARRVVGFVRGMRRGHDEAAIGGPRQRAGHAERTAEDRLSVREAAYVAGGDGGHEHVVGLASDQARAVETETQPLRDERLRLPVCPLRRRCDCAQRGLRRGYLHDEGDARAVGRPGDAGRIGGQRPDAAPCPVRRREDINLARLGRVVRVRDEGELASVR
jgi:hypothetical protein